jgi:hypothetical protein
MKKHLIVKNESKTNTIKDYIQIINDINTKFNNNSITDITYINSLNLVERLTEKDNSITDKEKIKIYDFIKASKRISL